MIWKETDTKIENHKFKRVLTIEFEEQDTDKEKAIVYSLFDLIKALTRKEE